MRVLTLSYNDIEGGAARATYRLHRGLLKIGIDSKMLVRRKTSEDPNIYGSPTTYHSLTVLSAVLHGENIRENQLRLSMKRCCRLVLLMLLFL